MGVADTEISAPVRSLDLGSVPAWLGFGVGIYGFLLVTGNVLLNDPDVFWHVTVGQWIIDHRAVPYTDVYSFTMHGAPWTSSSWLAQVLYAAAYKYVGWAGPVILASAAIASAFALFVHNIGRRFPAVYAMFAAIVAFALCNFHFFARPYALAMPVMVAWVIGLVDVSDSRRAPSLWLLPLMILWANLHGGFVFGLVLIVPFALDALWNAKASQRQPLALHWALFALAAILASCVTPYGWGSLLAARKILGLGELLSLVTEWQPVNFSHFGGFEACLLGLIGLALYRGIVLSPPRILIVLGLLHMAVSHVRNIEIFALLLPLVVARPLASLFPSRLAPAGAAPAPTVRLLAAIIVLSGFSAAFATVHSFTPIAGKSFSGAIGALKDRKAERVLNDYFLSGSLIAAGVPVFVDGRAELYGEKFVMAFYRALQLQDVDKFVELLKTYRIDATLLGPSTPAVHLLDHLDGWQRIYADDSAVVHIRVAGTGRDGDLKIRIRPALN